MPRLDSERIKRRIAEVFNGPDGVAKLAKATGIPHGTLRNAVAGRDQMRLYRIVRLEAALGVAEGSLTAHDNPGEQPQPPENPAPAPTTPAKDPKAPPTRTNGGDDRRGPRRAATLRRSA